MNNSSSTVLKTEPFKTEGLIGTNLKVVNSSTKKTYMRETEFPRKVRLRMSCGKT
jgi:hypothetical protein